LKLLPALFSAKAVLPSAFVDNFNRANSANLGAAYEQLIGTLTVASNQCQGAAASVDHVARYLGVFASNQFAQCKPISAIGASERYYGLGVRLSGTASFNGYTFNTRDDGLAGSGIYRWTAGLPTQILAVSGTVSWLPTDIMKFEAEGSTLRVRKNGAQVLVVVDATHTTGNPGLNLYDQAIIDDAAYGNL
jgi:hypothetical protein